MPDKTISYVNVNANPLKIQKSMLSLTNLLKKIFGLQSSGFKNIFAAKVSSIEKHPNADRLRVVKLNLGSREVYPVICGAFNFEEGDVVALALPGAEIKQNIHDKNHKPFILEKAKIRGVESQGMICARFELGLGPLDERPEIMVLKTSVAPGSQFTPKMLK